MCDQTAKFGLFLYTAIQRLGQLRARGDFLMDALLENCQQHVRCRARGPARGTLAYPQPCFGRDKWHDVRPETRVLGITNRHGSAKLERTYAVSVASSRSAAPRTDFSITPRVLAMMAAVARYGLLSSEQIARMDGGSRQKCTRFLQQLVELKLLRLVQSTPASLRKSFFDVRPHVFAITQSGLHLLAEAGVHINVKPKKSNVLIAHDIEMAETIFSAAADVARHGGVRFIDQPELMSMMSAKTLALPKPLRLQPVAQPHDFQHLEDILKKPTRIAIDPDRLIALALPDNTGWNFAYEKDRGTEDITAKRIKGKATYFRKVLGYTCAWRDGLFVAQWGPMCKSLRILVETVSEAHIATMIKTQDFIGAPAGLFLYTTTDRLSQHGVLGPAWRSAKADGISLLERA
jgi:protein involved in plasmid replication-relaxation